MPHVSHINGFDVHTCIYLVLHVNKLVDARVLKTYTCDPRHTHTQSTI